MGKQLKMYKTENYNHGGQYVKRFLLVEQCLNCVPRIHACMGHYGMNGNRVKCSTLSVMRRKLTARGIRPLA